MKSISFSLTGFRGFSSLLASIILLLLPYCGASAQAPAVPSAFQATYTELDNYLVNFNATLGSGNGSPYPTLMTGSLKASNSNSGPALLGGWNGVQLQNEVQLQLSALQAMGAQAIMVQIGFPVLNQSFLAAQGQSYSAFLSYYQGIAQAVHAAGMKVIVENDTLITDSVSGNWPGVGAFYQTLSWTQYQQARAQMAVLIAQTLQPDYLVVMEEPDLETANSGQTSLNTPGDAAAMLSQMLTAVTLPVRNPMPVITSSTPIARSTLARCRFIRANSAENRSTIKAAIRNGIPSPAE